jgi:hypothetical protein
MNVHPHQDVPDDADVFYYSEGSEALDVFAEALSLHGLGITHYDAGDDSYIFSISDKPGISTEDWRHPSSMQDLMDDLGDALGAFDWKDLDEALVELERLTKPYGLMVDNYEGSDGVVFTLRAAVGGQKTPPSGPDDLGDFLNTEAIKESLHLRDKTESDLLVTMTNTVVLVVP